MSTGPVALFGPGGETLRAAALALSEQGRPIGLSTLAPQPAQEFATASIANELWALGASHLHRVLDAADPAATSAYLAELEDRYGPLVACFVDPGPSPEIPFDEFSPDEWLPALRQRLAATLVVLRAAAPLIERRGGGPILLAHHPAPTTTAGAMLHAALDALPAALATELTGRPLRIQALQAGPEVGPLILALLA
ncbi:SDR family oxidoreductase [Tepidiforma sp.]|uniref:SDR family oxidoreductase n=1 Tax=Tepidiforma sp. TaxID=2682230 RepID=UPI002ADE64A3|nr:SDR family oxidoreductase [Tepidiforma sp.]